MQVAAEPLQDRQPIAKRLERCEALWQLSLAKWLVDDAITTVFQPLGIDEVGLQAARFHDKHESLRQVCVRIVCIEPREVIQKRRQRKASCTK